MSKHNESVGADGIAAELLKGAGRTYNSILPEQHPYNSFYPESGTRKTCQEIRAISQFPLHGKGDITDVSVISRNLANFKQKFTTLLEKQLRSLQDKRNAGEQQQTSYDRFWLQRRRSERCRATLEQKLLSNMIQMSPVIAKLRLFPIQENSK